MLIKEQLAYSQGSNQIVSQQQRQMQQQQQSQLQQQQQHHQHQYILQQQLGMPTQSMLLTPSNGTGQLTMMGTNPNHIFLSPIRGMDIQSQQQQGQQLPHQQQQQRQFQQQQEQQLVLQHDNGLGGQSMLLSPISSSPQLAMMGSNNNQIFLSPINMDILTGGQQQCQQQQQQQQQTQQTLHFLGVTCSTADANSNNVDLSDPC